MAISLMLLDLRQECASHVHSRVKLEGKQGKNLPTSSLITSIMTEKEDSDITGFHLV